MDGKEKSVVEGEFLLRGRVAQREGVLVKLRSSSAPFSGGGEVGTWRTWKGRERRACDKVIN